MSLIIWDFRNTIYNTDTEDFYEGALEVLEAFKEKYTQILISATDNVEQRIELIQKLALDKYFVDIIITHKTKKTFEDLIKKYNGPAEETYVIGDRYDSEIAIGNELGAKTIWIQNGRQPESLLGIKYWKKVSNISELPQIIK